uniref:Uncharacterized protein n=1 Tax=Panagrolaimus sp. JU765 TaxID=591449 RepID=A0AC34Q9U7_9BILA
MDPGCPVLERFLDDKKCFGMEPNCTFENSYSFDRIKCQKKSKWPQARNDERIQKKTFWEQGDFGAAMPRMTSMEVICKSKSDEDSHLECSDHLRICKAKNIFFDFGNFTAKTRYRNDVINEGQVGGRCQFFNKELLTARADEKSYLQSWGYELEHFESYDDFRMDKTHCDVIFEKPTIVIKLDAAVNMYHHFCDFVNLYLSQHINGSFSQDVEIFWWDTFSGGFVDDYFGDTWKAFTVHRPHELINYQRKKVCFKNALLPLLARQRLGIYYNMPLIDGCQGSGLFHAFSLHLIHRLKIVQNGPILGKIRITILQRNSSTRKIENIDEVSNLILNFF